MNIYAHVLPTADRQVADQVGGKLDELLADAVRGSRVVAENSELDDFARTQHAETLANQDTANTDKLEKSAPPRIRSKRHKPKT